MLTPFHVLLPLTGPSGVSARLANTSRYHVWRRPHPDRDVLTVLSRQPSRTK
jgi:hypothetical protein